MRASLRSRSSARAFTILELLIVIGIIGILASIAFPVLSTVRKAAVKMSAKNDATQFVNAINSYRMEYGRFPLEEVTGDDPEPIKTETEFMGILLADEDTGEGEASLNPRGIKYFDGKLQQRPGGHGLDLEGNYFDPWGNPYEIILDGNYDNKITILEKEMRMSVAVRSMGPDKVFEMPEDEGKSDDVKSWE